MKHADYKGMNKRNTDSRERQTARRLSGPLIHFCVLKKLFKKSVFHITVKQNLGRMFCFPEVIGISTGLRKGHLPLRFPLPQL